MLLMTARSGKGEAQLRPCGPDGTETHHALLSKDAPPIEASFAQLLHGHADLSLLPSYLPLYRRGSPVFGQK